MCTVTVTRMRTRLGSRPSWLCQYPDNTYGKDISDHDHDKDVSRLTSTCNTEFDNDSTFQGLGGNNHNNKNNKNKTTTMWPRWRRMKPSELNPNEASTSSDNGTKETTIATPINKDASQNNRTTRLSKKVTSLMQHSRERDSDTIHYFFILL